MTPAQRTALEGVAGKVLSASDVTKIDPLLPDRNDVCIAEILSAGRVKYQERRITERGIRAALTVRSASRFLRLLRSCAKDTEDGTIPAWLSPVLTAVGVPADELLDYADAFGSAYGWLRQEAGIDIGSPALISMLDIIAMSNPAEYGQTCATLKGLASVPDPILPANVSDALNQAEGRMTL